MGKADGTMDVFEAIRTLLAVRGYQERPVPEQVVRRILEAGRLTASAMNKQPWHFVVVQDRETPRYAVSDASRAIQDMLLAAWGEGVGGNWVSGNEAVKPLLGIPEELDVAAILPFGYPAAAVGQGRKERKPLAEIAHRERWGTPYA
jgi:nitroreductase